MRGDERQTDNLAAGLTFLCRTFIGFTEFPIGEKTKNKNQNNRKSRLCFVFKCCVGSRPVRKSTRLHVCRHEFQVMHEEKRKQGGIEVQWVSERGRRTEDIWRKKKKGWKNQRSERRGNEVRR